MITDTRTRGRQYESIALAYLVKRGLVCIAQNYYCRVGELDLVCRDGDELVVVEVRFRRSDRYGGAVGSITRSKRKRIERATELFLAAHPQYSELQVRFDIVAITSRKGDNVVTWLRDAFRADE